MTLTDRVFQFLLYGGIGLAVACVRMDSERIENTGSRISVPVGMFLAALLAPLYLVYRAVKIRSGVRIVLGWFAAFGAAIAGLIAIPAVLGVTLDGQSIEQNITGTYLEEDLTVAVTCPDTVRARPGDAFGCIVEIDGDTVGIDVTLEDTGGSLSWTVRESGETSAV